MARVLVAMGISMAGTESLGTALNMLILLICVTTLVGLCTGFARCKVLHRESETDVERMGLRNVGEGFSSKLQIKQSSFRISLSRSTCKQGNETSEDMDNEAAIWRRAILLGERCVPLSFSGLVLYDENGNQLPKRCNSNVNAAYTEDYCNEQRQTDIG